MSILDESRAWQEYLLDEKTPAPLKAFLEYWNKSAMERNRLSGIPDLYATVNVDLVFSGAFKKGDRVKVTMASRFGDVGLAPTTAKGGYLVRLYVDQLTDFSETL